MAQFPKEGASSTPQKLFDSPPDNVSATFVKSGPLGFAVFEASESAGTPSLSQYKQDAGVSPNLETRQVRTQLMTSPSVSSPNASPKVKMSPGRRLGGSPNRQPRAVKTELIEFTVETQPRAAVSLTQTPQTVHEDVAEQLVIDRSDFADVLRWSPQLLSPQPRPEPEPEPESSLSAMLSPEACAESFVDSVDDETLREVRDAMEALLCAVEAAVLGGYKKASAVSATTFTHGDTSVAAACDEGDKAEFFREDLVQSIRVMWKCTQQVVQIFRTDALPEAATDKGLAGILLHLTDDGSGRQAAPKFDKTLENDLRNLVTEKMEQFETVRATIELKLGAGSTEDGSICDKQLIRNRQRAARELPRKMEMLTMALFAHRLKISMLRERIVAAISHRAEIGRRSHERVALYETELERIRGATANLPTDFLASTECNTVEFLQVASEFHEMLQQAEESVEQIFPQLLTSVKVSSVHGRLAAEAASRCRAVLAAGERHLTSLHSAALATAEQAVATDGPLRAQIRLLDELQTMEALARQVLAELRKGSTDPNEVERLKAAEAEFGESLKQYLREQKDVVALLV